MQSKDGVQYIYEPQFEQLQQGNLESINAIESISHADMELEVLVGSTREKISSIVTLKVGDILELDKYLEEPLDISINGVTIASGESMIINDKIAVRLSKIKSMQEEY
ncbi:FliM/FliN family flagellar motor C-terminal domain-containing protein [Paraclostridium ghonii]|uniref:FliM/FliN family flagellar motor switch protein n=1 Tax=Paraclostridium ghonii TaxID=29358 RepID=UPI00202CB15C|nr:FliM/FliN family flagellar motor C-terminal domain-containing protein [Paeniclostridium ghonii]MCM0166518.1 FliM/FliN family flagellar motor C-terminal domain-containing protein [Paeniclostridium ghonii]